MDNKPTQYEAILKPETGSHTGGFRQLLVTPDGRTIITSGEDKTIRIWDFETKKQTGMLIGQIGPGPDGKIQAITLSRDGKYIVALVWRTPEGMERDTDVRVYELGTGNLQASFRYAGTLQDLNFSPDGKYLAMTGNPKQPIRCGYVYVYETEIILKGFGDLPASRNSSLVYDNDTLIPSFVRFIPDEDKNSPIHRIVVATWIHNKYEPGELEYTGEILWYSFSKKRMKEELRCETAELRRPNSPVVSRVHPDSLAVSREFVVITADHQGLKEFYCYDHHGQFVAAVPSDTRPAQPAFSKDGSHLIVGQHDDGALIQVKIYNTSFGQFRLKSTYYGHDAASVAVAMLDDGTAVSAGGDQNAIHFWDPAHLEGELITVIRGMGRVIHAVGLNEEEQIGIGNYNDMRLEDGSIILQRLFDLRSMKLEPLSLQDSTGFKRSRKESAQGHKLEFMEKYGYWNLYLDEEIPLTGDSDVPWYQATTFGFTEKGTVITGDKDGNVRVEALMSGHHERNLVGHTGRVLDHAAGSKWLVTAGADQVIRLWYLEDVERNVTTPLEPALNLFVGMDDEWVIWSRSGYYNASQKGDSRFGYHVNRGLDREALFFPGHRFIKSFFRPDIIQAIVERGSEEKALKELRSQDITVRKIDVSRILPPILELEENGILEAKDKSSVTFRFTVESLDPRNPITRVWIVQNETDVRDIPNKDWKSEKTGSMMVKIEATLPLQPGNNHFKILAQNKNTSSTPFIKEMDGPEVFMENMASRGGEEKVQAQPNILLGDQARIPDNGTLYLLAVGVSALKQEWKEGDYKALEYADDDATSIYNEFASKNGAFKSVEAHILLNEKATKKAILNAIDDIAGKINDQSRKRSQAGVLQRDVLFIFLSGHGIRSSDASELYFWSYDLDYTKISETGLSFIELGRKITPLPAEIILVTDACKSGMAGSNVARGIDPNELAKQIYAITERGMYILSATRSGRNAIEAGSLKHGVFTESILDKLYELKAGDRLNMLGLIDYVQLRVHFYTQSLKSEKYQTPVCRMYGDLLPLTVYKKNQAA